MTIIVFLFVLAVLILVHELGHFVVAKLSKMRVDEFALGFPPKIWSKKIGETTYALNLIPFGGYVKIFGEDPDEASISGIGSERSFVNKNRGLQAGVLVAGVFFNILLAWLAISISFMIGLAVPAERYTDSLELLQNQRVVITQVLENSPASKAGIKSGDFVKDISINSVNINKEEKISADLIKRYITDTKNTGKEFSFIIQRADKEEIIKVVPKSGIIKEDPNIPAIGISMGDVGDIKFGFFRSFWEGVIMTIIMVKNVAIGLLGFIYDAFTGQADFSQVSGPVGIANLIGDAARTGITYLLSLTALISINLAVLNFLPFPALDGGRLLFVTIEAIIRKRINPKVLNMTNTVGFFILILLMIVVTWKDIIKLF